MFFFQKKVRFFIVIFFGPAEKILENCTSFLVNTKKKSIAFGGKIEAMIFFGKRNFSWGRLA
eukprot:NODE_921_length_1137_cov_221.879596_g637_i0.p2 GENE.NODE_921_length_1137_cov_221.879596_g637_i0~~NODE_921_length_1137_cov_221.879596_g637_i0.p2  ORF type:complete len:62 (-),score=4.97 NODE_921_length_1137_cov_221.879596_g637_i0:416-601(-)